MIGAALLQLLFVALTTVNASYEVWKFWGYGGEAYITYSAATIYQLGALSIVCVLLASWAAISLKPVSTPWAAFARYGAISLFVAASIFYLLLASSVLRIRAASNLAVERDAPQAASPLAKRHSLPR